MQDANFKPMDFVEAEEAAGWGSLAQKMLKGADLVSLPQFLKAQSTPAAVQSAA